MQTKQTNQTQLISEVKNMNLLTELALIILGLIVLGIMYLILNKQEVPFLSSTNQTFIVLFIIGFMMCILAIGTRLNWTGNNWIHPFILLGIIIGALIIILSALIFLNISLPFNINEYQSLLILGSLIILKWLISIGHLVSYIFLG
ncbi:hypothetical protein [Candidatus Hodarchaeum mangrovi]